MPVAQLTPQLQDEIVTWLKLPLSLADCARRVPMDPESLRRWRRRGRVQEELIKRGDKQSKADRDREEPYRQFWIATEQARLHRKTIALGVIRDVMNDTNADVRVRLDAAKWFLERHHPDEYGRSTRSADVPPGDESDGVDDEADRKEAHGLLDELDARRTRKKQAG